MASDGETVHFPGANDNELRTRLDEIRARCDAASQGPWVVRRCPYAKRPVEVDGIYTASGERIVETDSGVYPPKEPDAQFIAHAREDVPWLLAQVAALQDWKERMQKMATPSDFLTECNTRLEQQVAALTQQIKDLLRDKSQLGEERAAEWTRAENAESKLTRQAAALREYGRHRGDCRVLTIRIPVAPNYMLSVPDKTGPCTCGFEAALQEAGNG